MISSGDDGSINRVALPVPAGRVTGRCPARRGFPGIGGALLVAYG